jgi:hypothetical protein
MTFDPTVTEFDAVDFKDQHRPVLTLQLRTAAGDVFENPQVFRSELDRAGEPDDTVLMEVPLSVQSASAPGPYYVDMFWHWGNPGTAQFPADINTFDPALLAPNRWVLTLNTFDFDASDNTAGSGTARVAGGPVTQGEGSFDNEVPNESAYAYVTALWRRGQPPSRYAQGFAATPPRWVNQGGAWSAVSGAYANAANVSFTSSVYDGLALRDNFSLAAQLTSQWPGSGNTLGLVFNYEDSANFYEVRFNPLGTATLNKVTNGTRLMLQTAAYPGAPKTPFLVNVQRNANRIRVNAAGTALFDLTDADHVGGKAGVFASWNKSRFDNFTVTQPTAWTVRNSDFATDATGWTPANGTWTVQDGYYRSSAILATSMSLSAPFTTNDYGLDARIYMEWPGTGNRGGLVYDYQDSKNYRAVVITPSKNRSSADSRVGLVEVVEVRNGVRTVLKSATCQVPAADFDFYDDHWRPISVSRVGGVTRVEVPGLKVNLELQQPIIGGARRVGMMTNWAPIRFDDVVFATAAVN